MFNCQPRPARMTHMTHNDAFSMEGLIGMRAQRRPLSENASLCVMRYARRGPNTSRLPAALFVPILAVPTPP
jgi:hypothetical protein